MGRIPYTAEQKEIAKIQRTAKNKQWQLANKKSYDEYLRSYYIINKVKLNAQRKINRQKIRERQQLQSTEIVVEIVVDNVVS
jgi:hypothetical protein